MKAETVLFAAIVKGKRGRYYEVSITTCSVNEEMEEPS